MDEAGSGRGRGKGTVRPQKKHTTPNTNRQSNHRRREGRMRRPPCGALTLSQRVFFVFFHSFFQISAAHRCACEAKSQFQFQFHLGVLSGQKRGGAKNGKDGGGVPGKKLEKRPILEAKPPPGAHGHAGQHHEKGTPHATSVHNTSGTDVFVI